MDAERPQVREARAPGDCPLCKAEVLEVQMVHACLGCGTRFHLACAWELGGCSTPGCAQAGVLPDGTRRGASPARVDLKRPAGTPRGPWPLALVAVVALVVGAILSGWFRQGGGGALDRAGPAPPRGREGPPAVTPPHVERVEATPTTTLTDPLAGTPWTEVRPAPGLSYPLVSGLAEDAGGHVWVAGSDALVQYLDGDLTRGRRRLVWDGLTAMRVTGEDEALVGTSDGRVFRVRGEEQEALAGDEDRLGERITALAEEAGVVWAGTEAGLFSRRDGAWTREQEPAGAVRDLLLHDGELVVATRREVWARGAAGWTRRWRGSGEEVWWLGAAPGALLVGSDRGLVRLDPSGDPATTAVCQLVMGAARDPAGGTWLASWTDGLRLDDGRERFPRRDATLDVLRHTQARELLLDRRGRLWLALHNPVRLLVADAAVVRAALDEPRDPLAAVARHDLPLRLTWGGEPLPGSDLRPRWTLTPEEHRHPLGELTGQLAEGVLTLSHVPAGRYGVWLVVAAHDASRDTPQDAYRPGDFWGAADGVAVPAAGAVELPLCRLVHVTAPHDNATRLPFRFQGVDSVPALESPVRFAWDPLPLDGVEYVVEVGTVDYDTQTASIGTVARVRTGEHEASVELAPSQGNRAYSFHLRAERGGRLVGRTSFTSLGVRDWNYEFRVVQRR